MLKKLKSKKLNQKISEKKKKLVGRRVPNQQGMVTGKKKGFVMISSSLSITY